jgi:hypothetical protein
VSRYIIHNKWLIIISGHVTKHNVGGMLLKHLLVERIQPNLEDDSHIELHFLLTLIYTAHKIEPFCNGIIIITYYMLVCFNKNWTVITQL